MRHYHLLMWLLLTAAMAGRSQTTAHFETTISVEDARGNRDSVVVGFDPEATNDLDAEFGETIMTTPFDSVLEVRAGILFPWPAPELSKKIILRSEKLFRDIETMCWGSFRIAIYISAKYQPVTLSWDSTTFLRESCLRGSFLVDHQLDELAGPINPREIPPKYYCLAARSSGVFDLREEALSEVPVLSSARVSIEW